MVGSWGLEFRVRGHGRRRFLMGEVPLEADYAGLFSTRRVGCGVPIIQGEQEPGLNKMMIKSVCGRARKGTGLPRSYDPPPGRILQ